MRFILVLIALVSLCSIQPSNAQSLAAIQQIGIAEFSSLRRSFYLAGVSAENTDADEQELLTTGSQAKRLDIKVVADSYSQRRFSQQWSQSLIVSASQDQLLAFDDALVNFQNLLDEPFKQGDTISIEAASNGLSTVYLNGVKAFEVEKPGFLELLLTTWIGTKPPSTSFKQSILNDSAAETLRQQFAQLKPNAERVAAIKTALENKHKKTNNSEKPVLVESEEELITTVEKKPQPVAKDITTSTPVIEQTAVAELPSAPPFEDVAEEAQAIDPAIYLVQQKTLQKLYATSASRKIKSNVRYPKRAAQLQQQGVVRVEVAVDRMGQIASMRVVEETQHKALNRAALKAVENAGQLNAIPAAIDTEYVTFVIPFQFLLQ